MQMNFKNQEMFGVAVNPKASVALFLFLIFILKLEASASVLRKVTGEEWQQIHRQREHEKIEFEKRRNKTVEVKTIKQSCECGKSSSKIINGVESPQHGHPWMVALYADSLFGIQFICGGTIINDFYILTAAHCTIRHSAKLLSARLGEHNISEDRDDDTVQIVYFSTVTEHPRFTSFNLENDYSILRTSSQILFSEAVLPICLPTADLDFYNKTAAIAGWGNTKISSVLLEQTVKTISPDVCRTKFSYSPKSIKRSMFCARRKNVDTCQGDSGGPVEFMTGNKIVQIGITSWGYGCALAEYPGVYSDVVYRRDWIMKQTSSGNFCK